MIDYKKLFEEALLGNYNHSKWDKGAFIGIKTISNTKVGSVGQDFIESLCNILNFDIEFPMNKNNERASQSPWDIKINGIKFELKTATEDTNGNYQFNHLRYHREYEAVLCLGVSPNHLYFYIASKADVSTGKAGKLVSMEKGANASYKLTKRPSLMFKIEDFEIKMKEFFDNGL